MMGFSPVLLLLREAAAATVKDQGRGHKLRLHPTRSLDRCHRSGSVPQNPHNSNLMLSTYLRVATNQITQILHQSESTYLKVVPKPQGLRSWRSFLCSRHVPRTCTNVTSLSSTVAMATWSHMTTWTATARNQSARPPSCQLSTLRTVAVSIDMVAV